MIRRVVFILFIGLLFSDSAFAQIVGDLVDSPVTLGPAQRAEAGKRFSIHSVSDPVLRDFTGIAVQVTSLATELEMSIRMQSDGTWSDWTPLHIVPSATGGTFVAGFYGDTVYSNARIELRITGDVAYGVVIHQLGTFDNRLDEETTNTGAPDIKALEGIKSSTIIPPPLITRSEWNAEPFRGSPSLLENPVFRYMTFHHAAGYSATTKEEGLAQVLAIQDLHQNVRGWSDIGYQFVIDRGGRLYQGRPFLDGSTSLAQVPTLALGAHVGGNNSGNIGVSILGCYHPPEGSSCQDELTPASLDTYTVLFAFLSETYGIEPTLIRGHRDFSSTACPGNNNYVLIPDLIEDVNELLRTGNAALGSAEMEAAVDDEGVVHITWTTLEDFGINSYQLEREYNGVSRIIHESSELIGSYNDSGIPDANVVVYNLYALGTENRQQRLTSVEIDIEFANSYVLTEVFPNPAQTEVQFRYKLKQEGIVELSLFDISGRRISTRSDGFQKNDRWYTTRLDVSTFASGVYYYNIHVEGYAGTDFSDSKSFVVLR